MTGEQRGDLARVLSVLEDGTEQVDVDTLRCAVIAVLGHLLETHGGYEPTLRIRLRNALAWGSHMERERDTARSLLTAAQANVACLRAALRAEVRSGALRLVGAERGLLEEEEREQPEPRRTPLVMPLSVRGLAENDTECGPSGPQAEMAVHADYEAYE